MYNKNFLIVICSICIFNTSFLFSQSFDSERVAKEKITNYLKEKFTKENILVRPYAFGDLIKVTPPEIMEIERLKDSVNKLQLYNPKYDSLAAFYDTQIKMLMDSIKRNRISNLFEIDHFYTTKKKSEQAVLVHSTFVMYPDGKMKDVHTHLQYELLNSEYDAYYAYYRKDPLYGSSYQQKDKNTYKYLEELYSNETISKEDAMRTLLAVVTTLKELHVYDTVGITRSQTIKWLYENNLKDFKNLTFSDVSPILDSIDDTTKKTIGYNIKVRLNSDDTTKIKAFYLEFDYDYIIRGVLPIEPPFNEYFTKSEAIKE